MNIKNLLIATVAGAIMFSGMVIPTFALGSSYTENFESFPSGSIDGHDGWSMFGNYDVAIVGNAYGYSSLFASQSLRISDAVTHDSFGDQTFAKALADAAGEGGQSHFEAQFDIASVMQDVQPGMHISISPDRGDGSRMSYLRFEDDTYGINVFFDDVQGTSNPAYFNETQIAKNLSRAVPLRVKISMDFIPGPSNDVVKIWIDGVLKITGTSWENYYRYDSKVSNEKTPRIVKTLLFRESGQANLSDFRKGQGYLIDNLSLSSGPIVVASPTNISQCKNNGWKVFNNPAFKNQGTCVSYIQSNIQFDKRPE